MEWTDITKKVKRGLPVLDREFLEAYYDEYTTRRALLMFYKRKLNFQHIAPFKAQNVDYILSNGWETILKDQLHKVVTKYKFHRSLESRFFMDVVRMMIAAEVAERVKPYRREKVSISQGILHYKMISMFSVPVWTFYSVDVHMTEGPYSGWSGWSDREDHPKLFVKITNDPHGGTYRQELDRFTEELYERLDAVCLSENVRLERFCRQSKRSIAQGIKSAELKSTQCKWIDTRKQ